jgi:hypothetical protein
MNMFQFSLNLPKLALITSVAFACSTPLMAMEEEFLDENGNLYVQNVNVENDEDYMLALVLSEQEGNNGVNEKNYASQNLRENEEEIELLKAISLSEEEERKKQDLKEERELILAIIKSGEKK